ncbi:MAG: pyridoxamine 5'-phosphate oxidase family protein [Spirochaetes bacterium]|nr:pyridoxamine 5'-phosphate oxidase family protein [Spirochaetota bacterium]
MRRSEFEEKDGAIIDAFLAAASFGFLATHREPAPGLTPINFVWFEGHIHFHGSRIGAKMKDLAADPRASFAVAEETTLVPSTLTDPKLACPATAFFKSVIVTGVLEAVVDGPGKVRVLEAFMKKLQPEGGYAPFDLADADYLRNVNGTSVVRLRTETLSAKFKFGQNKNEADWTRTAEGLTQRGRPGDLEAVGEMKRLCPFHRVKDALTGGRN